MFSRFLGALAVASVLLAAPVSAGALVSAEELARGDLKDNYYAAARALGVTFYDGPYDGEVPIIACEYDNVPGCTAYTGLQVGVNVLENVAPQTDQDVEDFIFYHAVRNVYAGLYYRNAHQPEHVDLLKSIGVPALTLIEIMRLKTGEQPLTLFSSNASFKSLISRVQEVY